MSILCTISSKDLENEVNIVSNDNLVPLGRTVWINERIEFDWVSSGIRFLIQPLSTKVTLEIEFEVQFPPVYVTFELNCERQEKVWLNHSTIISRSFTLETNMKYEVAIRKITELGIIAVARVSLIGAKDIKLDPKQSCVGKKRILAIGDSYTCGYGVEERNPCPYSVETEDVTHAYAFLLSRLIKADIHIVARSGHGLVKNHSPGFPIPHYFNRTLYVLPEPKWNHSNYQPHVITIMLGLNDFSTEDGIYPNDESYVTGYIRFVRILQELYSTARILLLCPPKVPKRTFCHLVHAVSIVTSVDFFAIPIETFDGGAGCDYHPYYLTQINMTNAILPTMEKIFSTIYIDS